MRGSKKEARGKDFTVPGLLLTRFQILLTNSTELRGALYPAGFYRKLMVHRLQPTDLLNRFIINGASVNQRAARGKNSFLKAPRRCPVPVGKKACKNNRRYVCIWSGVCASRIVGASAEVLTTVLAMAVGDRGNYVYYDRKIKSSFLYGLLLYV